MPVTTKNKIGISLFVSPDTFRAIEESRSPSISRSAFCAMALEEIFSVAKHN